MTFQKVTKSPPFIQSKQKCASQIPNSHKKKRGRAINDSFAFGHSAIIIYILCYMYTYHSGLIIIGHKIFMQKRIPHKMDNRKSFPLHSAPITQFLSPSRRKLIFGGIGYEYLVGIRLTHTHIHTHIILHNINIFVGLHVVPEERLS